MNKYAPHQKALEEQLDEVIAQLQDIAVLDTDSGDWVIRTNDIDQTETDENSQADAAEEADERIAILAELENRYRSIIHALKKMEGGTYGICEISGETIEEGRLVANPAARTCVHHMESEFELPLP
ncbi:TraR/DksA C4-type zinc finger protein [Patescibacteria group bacterium]|nr:TraR/DksA C4-type zinc finger protein [Patescibacteria group bacterium]